MADAMPLDPTGTARVQYVRLRSAILPKQYDQAWLDDFIRDSPMNVLGVADLRTLRSEPDQ
ncbi:MAG: hypothetical protein QM658_04055 [Gordonia sp. (in: high G+C Gram-positive bacteria)]